MDMEDIEETENIKNKNKGRKLPFNFRFIIGLVIIVLFLLFLVLFRVEIPEKKTPIWGTFSMYKGEDNTTVWRNEKLDVKIINSSSYDNSNYTAEWIDNEGYKYSISHFSPLQLYESVLYYTEDLSENQLRWFEYMLKSGYV
jgi:hypothetical protein